MKRRGLQNIRTMTEKNKNMANDSNRYLHLAVLAMHKARLTKELSDKQAQVSSLTASIDEHETRTIETLKLIDFPIKAEKPDADYKGGNGSTDVQGSGRFRIKY